MKKREIYGGSGRGRLVLKVGVSHLKRDGFGMYAFGKQKGEKSFGMYAFGKQEGEKKSIRKYGTKTTTLKRNLPPNGLLPLSVATLCMDAAPKLQNMLKNDIPEALGKRTH